MDENILEAFQPNITERLGKIYSMNSKYNLDIKKEEELEEKLVEKLSKEQMLLVEQYHEAMCATMGTCELLAYKQGMKDLFCILTEK